MKRALSVLALTALTACGGGGGGGGGGFMPVAAPAPTPAPVDCSVVLYGDSILWGWIPEGRLDPSPAQTIKRLRPAYTVDDRTVPGKSAVDQAEVFNNENRTSRIVVLEYGVVDMIRALPNYSEALTSMVTYAKAEGRKVVVTGLAFTPGTSEEAKATYTPIAAKVAADTGVVYADWPSVSGEAPDGIHPEAVFSRALTEKLIAALDRALPECK